MEIKNILVIVGAGGVLVLFWIIVGVRHLRFLRASIKEHWEGVLERLRKRQDLLPNLIETVRMFEKNQEELMGKLILERHKAALEERPGLKKIELEHALSTMINEVIALEAQSLEMATDTNFMELKKEISDVEMEAEERTRLYNEMVRYYDNQRRLFLLIPLAAVFGYEREDIFEVER